LLAFAEHVELEVSDNGSGFDFERAIGRGQGLVNLRARADDLGGALEVDSSAGRGTCVRIRVPI
jgi:signal transduction histidine kinase